MNYIKGKFRKIIYHNENGYLVAVFRLKETNDSNLTDFVNKSLPVTGVVIEVNLEQTYILYGHYLKNERYGYQYQFTNYEKEIPSDETAIIEYLSSSLIKGCGPKTAFKIVAQFGIETLQIIKSNPDALLQVKGLSQAKANQIYRSLQANESLEDTIQNLQAYGFNLNECPKLYQKYRTNIFDIINQNIYQLKDLIEFNRLDWLFRKHQAPTSEIRLKACFLEAIERNCWENGHVYVTLDAIKTILKRDFNLVLPDSSWQQIETKLIAAAEIVVIDSKYYLKSYAEMESNIANSLWEIEHQAFLPTKDWDTQLTQVTKRTNLKYNQEQQVAIKTALSNHFTIISGGPGTGKTTIINAITRAYLAVYNLKNDDLEQTIALIAPTGRAARRMNQATRLPAMTIHRYLKWNKDTNRFAVNEFNPNQPKLVIIDEASMIDLFLFDALLKGIAHDVQLILVGDSFQLPSVGPGLVLNDLITSKQFNYCELHQIYRQSDESYIPYLARDIKTQKESALLVTSRADYRFLPVSNHQIKATITQICQMYQVKGEDAMAIQILAPLYKGENGIDNLNRILQAVFNPPAVTKKETQSGMVIYRENDKVLQLTNQPEFNIYNGDIGLITTIDQLSKSRSKTTITINFDGNLVTYPRSEWFNFTHAYAITIHKSQGSEFNHVIMPICFSYQKMLYNKLIYTGVSRAQKSLIILGSKAAFKQAILSDYSQKRQTTLKTKIWDKFNASEHNNNEGER